MEPQGDDNKALFAVPENQRSRTSDVIVELIKQAQSPGITLRNLTDRLGDRTFGMLLMLIALFNVLPLVSIIGGILIATLGLQMILGRRKAWLPSVILDRELPNDKVQAILRTFEPKVRKLEQYIYPRIQYMEAPVVDQVNGCIILLLGLLISLPFPFTNIAPAFVVMVMGLGLMERDGLLQIGSFLLGMLSIGGIGYFLILS
ncbi:TPA: exopolysaccharide biosynthesis protein [Vibrio vulnificus]|uniref:exopolysaccharide biosynthesis protein n=1 Tax=Vibrio vulnificus TaxID=672 RepID=UPI001CDC8AA7|nr:exopolysaccharide biosynthesis protein [Vibrio vulnificus]EGR0751417.1 exopolysaccharide biosynthesis protein [Vibrio vulnificus]ELP1875508.1 exopolysaccharide biosynthesis protein [Vibrio vulnificus]MCA3936721.1 exopolysaccharide biosynthesis protein [Vibrio vulnificus]HDY7485480.1 exopolysaccharide biosynthesis protein [Vibrio vulnificus]HDY8058541.1 exopolysaccharide biosynthesis protein [Vibrio vulnificus]